jgi:hypothetical protein
MKAPRPALRAGLIATLALLGAVPVGSDGAQAAPYCVMRKPFFPARPNCFEFYLADTAITGPGQRAVVAGAACAATPYSARQGWEVDPTLPGPHADWQTGDRAVHVLSPFHQNEYKCNAGAGTATGGGSTGGGTAGGGSLCPTPPAGCQLQQTSTQPEARDATGRITVEASIIHVLSCSSGPMYIYQYTNRSAFRVVRPPNWGNPIGGRDFQSCAEAQAVAAGSTGTGTADGGQGQTGGGGSPGVHVFVLADIGVVAATQESVKTRLRCEWAGGGPRPCPQAGPAQVLGTLGGPYPSESAARADMKGKLDCQRGYWGAFIPYGSGRAWLQNNVTTADCRSVKQL